MSGSNSVEHEECCHGGMVAVEQVSVYLWTCAGKLLTTIDAAIPQGRQNKAIKDLIRTEINALDALVYKSGYDSELLAPALLQSD